MHSAATTGELPVLLPVATVGMAWPSEAAAAGASLLSLLSLLQVPLLGSPTPPRGRGSCSGFAADGHTSCKGN
jgi:hypothetical protein